MLKHSRNEGDIYGAGVGRVHGGACGAEQPSRAGLSYTVTMICSYNPNAYLVTFLYDAGICKETATTTTTKP